jgi:hypothetical protein
MQKVIEKTEKGWFQIVPIDQGTEEFDREFFTSLTTKQKWANIQHSVVFMHLLKGGTLEDLVFDKSHYLDHPIWNY